MAQEYTNRGELVPDSVTDQMVRQRLQANDALNGFILDGYRVMPLRSLRWTPRGTQLIDWDWERDGHPQESQEWHDMWPAEMILCNWGQNGSLLP